MNYLKVSEIIISGKIKLPDKLSGSNKLPLSLVQITTLPSKSSLQEKIPQQYIPVSCGGSAKHNQILWKDFFTVLEQFQSQCISAGRKLVTVISEIRLTDTQGANPSRRQLHAQHRALSRALMDPEIQILHRKGNQTMDDLRSKWEILSCQSCLDDSGLDIKKMQKNDKNIELPKDYITVRFDEVVTIFNEVDRAVKRLEQLTEQRRERLRELTRQRTLEDEMNEVSTVYCQMSVVFSTHLLCIR